MKIQKGRVAALLVVLLLAIPIGGRMLLSRAEAKCNATPYSEPNSTRQLKLDIESFGWDCHIEWENGLQEDRHFFIIP